MLLLGLTEELPSYGPGMASLNLCLPKSVTGTTVCAPALGGGAQVPDLA